MQVGDTTSVDMDLCNVNATSGEDEDEPNEVLLTHEEAVEFATSHPPIKDTMQIVGGLKLLGLPENADPYDQGPIDSAMKVLVRRHHPDKAKQRGEDVEAACEVTKDITQAYRGLVDHITFWDKAEEDQGKAERNFVRDTQRIQKRYPWIRFRAEKVNSYLLMIDALPQTVVDANTMKKLYPERAKAAKMFDITRKGLRRRHCHPVGKAKWILTPSPLSTSDAMETGRQERLNGKGPSVRLLPR